MLYDNGLKQAVLDVLETRMSSIADCVTALLEQGYDVNKNKKTILDWSSILLHAYQNIDVLDENQHKNIDNIYNKIIKL